LDPNIVVYGVRKADIERVKTMNNWINVEDYIDSLIQKNKEDLLRSSVTIYKIYEIAFSNKRLMSALSEGSLFKVTSELMNPKIRYSMYNLEKIVLDFDPDFLVEYNNYRTVAKNSVETLKTKYPMLQILQEYLIDSSEKIIADYINLIDKTEEQRKTLCTHI
jgi:heat shock protein HspQ